jgi:hypothetical protein
MLMKVVFYKLIFCLFFDNIFLVPTFIAIEHIFIYHFSTFIKTILENFPNQIFSEMESCADCRVSIVC